MFNASEDAEDAFYAAFSAGGLEDMMRIWAPQDDVVCIHPGGPRLLGLREIRQSWAQIFNDALPRSFILRGRIVSGDANQRIHLLEENISVPGTAFIVPPILATNIYRRLSDGWRLVMHHASVAPSSVNQTEPSTLGQGKAGTRLH